MGLSWGHFHTEHVWSKLRSYLDFYFILAWKTCQWISRADVKSKQRITFWHLKNTKQKLSDQATIHRQEGQEEYVGNQTWHMGGCVTCHAVLTSSTLVASVFPADVEPDCRDLLQFRPKRATVILLSIVQHVILCEKKRLCKMLKDSTFFLLPQSNNKVQQNRSYAITNTPEQITRTRYKICRIPEHDAAIQLNLALSWQEVKHRKNNITSGYFSK